MKSRSVQLARRALPAVNVGTGHPTRVMALVGSTSSADAVLEVAKIEALTGLAVGPDIVSDLSLRASRQPLWRRIVDESPFVASCLPIYTARRDNGVIDPQELLDVALSQIEGGVGMLTIHPTPSRDLIALSRSRLVPWTSRGGGLTIVDLLATGESENVYRRILPELAFAAADRGCAISLGASFRSATIFDSGDAVQTAEIEMQLAIASELEAAGVQVLIEGPGHARPRDIAAFARTLGASGYPIVPLGPIPTDVAIGQDHIASAIGVTLLGLMGCASVIAAVTREEHTGGIPAIESTVEAVQAALVAAHIIDLELLGDDHLDRAVAEQRAHSQTCIAGQSAPGCSRCGTACPLVGATHQASGVRYRGSPRTGLIPTVASDEHH